MHAVLEEMRIPHGYQEFEDIAHNLRLLSEQVKQENFAFAARPLKLPAEKIIFDAGPHPNETAAARRGWTEV
jgi:hypothetical protein